MIGVMGEKPPHIEVTSGVKMDKVEGAVLYSATVPIFYRLPFINTAARAPVSCKNICNYKMNDDGTWTPLIHKDDQGEELYSGARVCGMIHDTFEINQANRKLLDYLEEQHSSKPAPDLFPPTDESNRRVKRVALSEPLGNLLEILFGVPSASTFRTLTAHVNYIDQFSKRLHGMIKSREASFVTLGNAVSKIAKQTREGFSLIQKEVRNITTAYKALEKEYLDIDMSVLSLSITVSDMANLQHSTLAYMWLEKSRDLCLQKKIPGLFLSRERD